MSRMSYVKNLSIKVTLGHGQNDLNNEVTTLARLISCCYRINLCHFYGIINCKVADL